MVLVFVKVCTVHEVVHIGCVWMHVLSQPGSHTAAKLYVARLYACNWLLFGCLYA
jgi:hypothetical protein